MLGKYPTAFARSRRLIRQFILLVMASALVVLVVASPAQAHPTLLQTLPQAGYSYSQSPIEIGMVFDQPVAVHRLTVLGQARGPIATSNPLRSPGGTRITVTPDKPLPAGNYTVRWQITAEDGDLVDGTFDFGVGVRTATGNSDIGSEDTVGFSKVVLLRWILFGGLALALGGVVGDAMVRDRSRRARLKRDVKLLAPRPWVLNGSLLGVVAVFALGLLQVGSGDLVDGMTGFSFSKLTNSTAGWILAVEALGFSLSALASLRPRSRMPVVGLSAVIAGEAWRSHLHAASAWLGSATVGVHLVVAALWVGVLIHVVRTALHWRDDPRQVVALFRRYATYALAGYLVVIATGVLAAILVVPSWASLTTTTYGQVLLIKIVVVVLVTSLALAARRGLRLPISTHTWGGLRFAQLERASLVVVLGISALLTAVSPAPASSESSFPAPIDGPAIYLGNLAGQVSTGFIASDDQLQIRLHVPESTTTGQQSYRVNASATATGGLIGPLKLKPCGNGCFTAPFEWARGMNTIDVSVHAAGWEGGTLSFVVPWPPRDGRRLLQRVLDTMSKQPEVVLAEGVTSNTHRSEGMSSHLRLSGAELLKEQPYRSGIVSGVVILGTTAGRSELGFGLTAEGIFVRMTLDPQNRILSETISTPNHLLTRRYSYPSTAVSQGQGNGGVGAHRIIINYSS